MADYDNLAVGQLVETAAHINGWQKLRRLRIGGVLLHNLEESANIGIATGTYLGNGAASQAITGVGFSPRFLMIYTNTTTLAYVFHKSLHDSTYTRYHTGYYEQDYIISLDADGFTVGDGTGGSLSNHANINSRTFIYIAWR